MLRTKKQLEAEEYIKQIELKIQSLDEDMKSFNEGIRYKGSHWIPILNNALAEIKQQVVAAKKAEDIVAASEMLQKILSGSIQLIEKRICWLKAIEYFKDIEEALGFFEKNRYMSNIHEKNNPSPSVITLLNSNISKARDKINESKTTAEIIKCVENFKEKMLPNVLQEIENESDREIGRILRKIAAAIKKIPFVGVKISSYIKQQKRKQGLFRSSVGQLKNIRDNLKESPFELKSGKK